MLAGRMQIRKKDCGIKKITNSKIIMGHHVPGCFDTGRKKQL
jgi:hypothetical protein